ncbi:unnamed protein product [Peronospora farinosa]|uniref:RxLR effector protein n=1 Tax=Peronospora farinosa TaxID=134698 RepID=A0ABN8BX38_9STRA|nr:unnamed protein product [Peronospora farinosa]
MRLDSIFFVAVLFACFNLSSISVVSITFKAPAHEFDVEAAKEERTSSIPVFDTVIKKIKSMTSSRMEEMVDVNNVVEVYKTLQRHKGILSHNERYNAGISWTIKLMTKFTQTCLKCGSSIREVVTLR